MSSHYKKIINIALKERRKLYDFINSFNESYNKNKITIDNFTFDSNFLHGYNNNSDTFTQNIRNVILKETLDRIKWINDNIRYNLVNIVGYNNDIINIINLPANSVIDSQLLLEEYMKNVK